MSTAQYMNRTGMQVDPDLASEMEELPDLTKPSSEDLSLLSNMRAEAVAEAEPLGSLPEVEVSDNQSTLEVLLDRLGDRLAFERSGTRLYETLVSKLETLGSFPGGPSLEQAQHICSEELEHFHMLMQAIVELDGDPTMVTPAADLGGVISSGIAKAVNDPRTTVAECLEALLVAELTDNECWESLINLTQQLGYPDLVKRFNVAKAEEREHLKSVRAWRQAYDRTVRSNAEFADDELSDSTLGES